jgi:hypothetical protein
MNVRYRRFLRSVGRRDVEMKEYLAVTVWRFNQYTPLSQLKEWSFPDQDCSTIIAQIEYKDDTERVLDIYII